MDLANSWWDYEIITTPYSEGKYQRKKHKNKYINWVYRYFFGFGDMKNTFFLDKTNKKIYCGSDSNVIKSLRSLEG